MGLGETFLLYKIHKPVKYKDTAEKLCPKRPRANKTRMGKPLADNFKNLNDITFLSNSQTIYYMVYLY